MHSTQPIPWRDIRKIAAEKIPVRRHIVRCTRTAGEYISYCTTALCQIVTHFASASTLQTNMLVDILMLSASGGSVWLSVKGANAAPSFLFTPVIKGYDAECQSVWTSKQVWQRDDLPLVRYVPERAAPCC
jgi:hypothetical protein